MRRALVAAAAGVLLAACPAVAAAPLALHRVTPVRGSGKLTVVVELNQAWRSSALVPRSVTQLSVLYDVNGDGQTDHFGRIVYTGTQLVERIGGLIPTFKAVSVHRAGSRSLEFRHPLRAFYLGVKHKTALRIVVQLQSAGHVSRVPRKGWMRVPKKRLSR